MTTEMQPRVTPVCGQVCNGDMNERHLCEQPAGHDGPHVCWCGDVWTDVDKAATT